MKISVELERVEDSVQVRLGDQLIQVCRDGDDLMVMHNGKPIWGAAGVMEEPKVGALKAERPIVVFDLETTGISPKNDRIIQFSAVKLNEDLELVDELDISINPGYPISPGASKVHGFTNEDLVDSPTFEKMAPKIKKFLEGSDLCGHNLIRYDLKMLMAEFERHTRFRVDIEQRRLFDTLLVSRKMREGEHNLEACCQHYCGEGVEDAHDGLSDATATANVLVAMLKKEQIGFTQADKISRGKSR
jgi:DNA polymerase-3 subunit epsilon